MTLAPGADMDTTERSEILVLLTRMDARLDGIDARLAAHDARFDTADAHLSIISTTVQKHRQESVEMEQRLDAKIDRVGREIVDHFSRVYDEVNGRLRDLEGRPPTSGIGGAARSA